MTTHRPHANVSRRGPEGAGTLIPTRMLLVAGPFGQRLPANAVAAAVARGIDQAGHPSPDVLTLSRGADEAFGADLALDRRLDERLRAARALVLVCLELRSLLDGVAFEIATRARQAGVPAYAITRDDELGAFGARMLDLQLVLEARGERGLAAAGRELATIP